MAKFASVSPGFWMDDTVSSWSDSQRLLALYLLTTPHRNLQGIYRLPLSYAADDLGWSEARVKRVLKTLGEDGFVDYDAKAKVVLLPKTLRYYKPSTEAQLTGALRALAEVPKTPLKRRFMELAEMHGADDLAKALSEGSEV